MSRPTVAILVLAGCFAITSCGASTHVEAAPSSSTSAETAVGAPGTGTDEERLAALADQFCPESGWRSQMTTVDPLSSHLKYNYILCQPPTGPSEYGRVMVFPSDEQKNRQKALHEVVCDSGFGYEGPGWMISPSEGDIASGLEAAGYTRQDC